MKAHLVFEHESILPERPREVLGEVGGELLSVSRVVSVRCYGERVLHPGPNVPEMPRRSRRGAVVRHQVAQVASVRCRWNLLSLSSLLSALSSPLSALSSPLSALFCRASFLSSLPSPLSPLMPPAPLSDRERLPPPGSSAANLGVDTAGPAARSQRRRATAA